MTPVIRIGLSLVIAAGLVAGFIYLFAPGVLGFSLRQKWAFTYGESGGEIDMVRVFPTEAECEAARSETMRDSDYRASRCELRNR